MLRPSIVMRVSDGASSSTRSPISAARALRKRSIPLRGVRLLSGTKSGRKRKICR